MSSTHTTNPRKVRPRAGTHRAALAPSAPPLPMSARLIRLSGTWHGAVLAPAATLLLLLVSFAPMDVWPCGYVAFVPWLLFVGMSPSAKRVYIASYVLGFVFFATTVYWLFIVTVLGAVVLFVMFAFYFVLVACTVRHFVRQRRWPLAVTFPLIWVGCEAVRSMTVLQFPWNLLGHSQHAVLPMIQIADLVGAYGVSFVLAAVNGALADAILIRNGWPVALGVPAGPHRWQPSAIIAAVLVVATFIYGEVQLHRGTMRDGPRIAVIQGNNPNYVEQNLNLHPTQRERADRYFSLVAQVLPSKPDLILLPETPWTMYLNNEFLEEGLQFRDADEMYQPEECYNKLRDMAVQNQAYVVTGSISLVRTPLQLRADELRYNSAFVFSPAGSRAERYDKIHLVLVGEYLPFRYGMLRFVYLWLNTVVPFGTEDYEYSLTAGGDYRVFGMQAASQNGAAYHFATPICYENVMPYISRRFVTADDKTKRCDFLLNLSNDGWFLHSWELPQHLAASVFRAVENRVGVARAVNTGISCFVDPDGRVHDEVKKEGRLRGPGVDGYSVANVRVDSRQSVYSRTGDVFATTCGGLWGLAFVDYFALRRRLRRRRKEAAQ